MDEEDTSQNGSDWPVWKLSLLLCPFTYGAVAINLFMLGLIGQMAGVGALLSPVSALIWSIPVSVPLSWLVGRWVHRLLAEAR